MSTTNGNGNYAYQPGAEGSPFGNALWANALDSNYAANSAYGASTSDLFARDLQQALFDATPQKYLILKLLFEQPFEQTPSDEYYWREYTSVRNLLTSNAIVVATAASPGNTVSATYTVTAASLNFVTLDMLIGFNDAGNTKGIVTAINTATNQITITSQTSAGLPASAVGDIFIPMSTFRADGQSIFQTYQRLTTLERYNYIQRFLRARRWGRVEQLKMNNLGTTDYYQKDTEELMKQTRFDYFATFFNGTRGEFATTLGEPGKSMGGIFPLMTAAGSASATTTVANLQATLEALAFATDYKAEGGVRFICCVPRLINEISKLYKQALTRYRPDDMTINLEINQLIFGGLKFVLIPCMLLQEPSLFPASFANKIFVLDMETIKPCHMKGLPPFEMGGTLMLEGPNGTREDFKDLYIQGNLGLKFYNPLGSFTIDVQ